LNAPTSIKVLIARAAEKPVALARLARVLAAKGDGTKARELIARALELAANNGEVRSIAAQIMSRGVPGWHFSIVRDETRNEAYDAALRRALRPGMRVLEIGAGSGLLAMMAARTDAAEVVTCEMNPAVAEAAREIIVKNGLADRVRVVAKLSSDLDLATDLGGPAEVMVSEIVSNNMVGEAALAATEQAFRRLLRAGALIIPARGIVRVALAEDAKAERERMGMVSGFDLSPFNRLAAFCQHIRVGDERLTLRSDAGDLFTFDFQAGGPFPEARASVALTAHGGPVNGVAQWIRLDMDDQGYYENRPAPGATSCWAVLFYPLPQSIDPCPGDVITVHGTHDRQTLLVWADIG